MPETTHGSLTRRNFIKSATVSGVSIMSAQTAFGTKANERLKLGVIGCGERGVWIGHLFQEHTNTEVVALADYFKARTDQAGEQLDVPQERHFIGLDGYKELLESGVDAVAIESPPYYHPEQTAAALERDIHVFLAKPVAVDPWGCNVLMDAARKSDGRASCLVDFQTRADPLYIEAVQRVHDGMIGDPVCLQAYYHGGRLGLKGHTDGPTGRLLNWHFDKVLSGDIIVEQSIHVLDVADWLINAHPESAHGYGGLKARTDVGDSWDHFVIAYQYPAGQLLDFGCSQFAPGFHDICVRAFGAEGAADTHYGGRVAVMSRAENWEGGVTSQIYQQGAVNNMKAFCSGILSGDYINSLEEGVNSTLSAILGRQASYTGATQTWDAMIKDNQRLEAELELPEDGPYDNPWPQQAFRVGRQRS